MVIRYYDKDGKRHNLILKPNQPIWIGSEIGNTGEYAVFKIEERKEFNKDAGMYTTMGSFDVRGASEHGMSLFPEGHNQILIGPSK